MIGNSVKYLKKTWTLCNVDVGGRQEMIHQRLHIQSGSSLSPIASL